MKNPIAFNFSVPAWLLILYVLGLVVCFFGFTDITRFTEASFSLISGFVALLGIAVLAGVSGAKQPA